MKTDNRINESIGKVLDLFKSGNVPKAISLMTNPRDPRPCGKWSLRNKLIMFCNQTTEARGFNQWRNVERKIKSGAKAFYILSPYIINEKDKETGKEEQVLKGFRPTPVFRLEDTEGKELVYKELEVKEFDLKKVAEAWGIDVKMDWFSSGVYGCYSHGEEQKTIFMCSPEEAVFYHELAHAGHDRTGLLKQRTKGQREVVAEFVASVLMEMRQKENKNFGQSYEYLKTYAEGQKIEKAVFSLIGDIEKTLKEIYETEESLKQ